MASVGKTHSCPPAKSPETKLQIMPFENETVDAGNDDEAIEVQRPNVVAVGRGPTKLELEHHLASGHAKHRTWCDACMKARGIAGKTATDGSLVERTRTHLLRLIMVIWKLDGTEDDDDDEDDEVAQTKLLILVAQDVKTGAYAATCLREKGVSE